MYEKVIRYRRKKKPLVQTNEVLKVKEVRIRGRGIPKTPK